MRGRRVLAVLMAAAGSALLVGAPVSAADEVRTTTELLGYDLEATAAPITVRFFDDFIPIPTDPGEPQMELTASHTSARIGTGPSGRAVASSIWPGPAFGDGFGTIVGDESQTYPIRAAARYPGAGEEDWEQHTTIPNLEGFGMHAAARGLDVAARSEGGGVPGPVEAVAKFGQVRSESVATVEDAATVVESVSEIARIDLLEGVISLEHVRSELRATSDGVTSSSTGRTVIGGIEVLGVPVALTDSGLVVQPEEADEEEGDDGPSSPVADVTDPLADIVERLTSDLVADGIEETLGIHIEVFDQTETLDGPVVERVAGGVTITVDVQVLRDYLQPLIDLVPVGDALEPLPNEQFGELKGLFFEILGLGPTVEFVLGRGMVATAASPPFELPELPPPPPLPPPASSGVSAPPPPTTDGVAEPPDTGVSLPPPTTSAQPPPTSVAPPETVPPEGPVLAAEPIALPEPFEGIPVVLVGFGLLAGALPAWGLRGLRESAVGLSASHAPRALPDLRSGDVA